MTTESTTQSVTYDFVPVRRFHWRVSIACATGSFSDGYVLGVSGIALITASDYVHISNLWLGLLASATLLGLFFGALICGRLVDRFGRKPFYGPLMLVFAIVSILQFWTDPGWSLFIVRLLLGLLLGGDYVASKTLLAEYVPAHWRGRALSMLGIGWATGFAGAYTAGLFLRAIPGSNSWHIMLVSSAVPAMLAFLLRLGIPESPRWLTQTGNSKLARRIITEKLGADVELPTYTPTDVHNAPRVRSLFTPVMLRPTMIACMAYAIAVMPNFALGTFSPRVLQTLGVQDSFTGALGYNMCIALGAFTGYFIVDRLERRTLIFGGFLVAALLLVPLTFVPNLNSLVSVGVFAMFALVLVSTGNGVYVYPAELFPTELRGSGVGFAVAASRLGSAVTTFLMPIVVSVYDISVALGACMVLLLFGATAGFIWGPETSNRALADT